MKQLLLVLSFFISATCSAQIALQLKKNNRSVQTFWQGSIIAFQTNSTYWEKGEIMKITPDSFYIRPFIVKYHMFGKDTVLYKTQGFKIADVYAVPKRGVYVDHVNGRWQLITSAGNVKWYWLKSGKVFKLAGAAYAALLLVNGINGGFSFSEDRSELIIAAALFATGVILDIIYSPVYKMGRKHKLRSIDFAATTT
jgi:hypothetical protein